METRKFSSPNRRRRSRSGKFAWFVVIAGLLSAAALAIYGVLHGSGPRDPHAEWRQLADKLKTQGEPLVISEVTPAPVPPDEDFFAADVFTGLAQGAPRSPLLQRALEPGGGLKVADLLASATKDGGASLESIAAAMGRAGFVRKQTDFLLAGDRVRAGMRTLGLDFTPITEAADRPRARFPIDYAQPFPPLPHAPYVEALGNWLAIRAIAQLSTGDADAAALDLLLIGRLADAVATEPFPASQRARRLLLGLFAGCVRVGIGWNVWSDEHLASFGDSLERARLLTDLAWAIRGERARLNSAIDAALAGGKPTASEPLQAWLGPDLVGLDVPTLRARQVAINRTTQDFLEAIERPDGVRPPVAPAEGTTPLPPAARERLQGLVEEARVAAQLQTYLAQAQVACALERFRLAHGAYPETLADLPPTLLATVPPDPMTAAPLAYERQPEGYRITGAGWNSGQPWIWAR